MIGDFLKQMRKTSGKTQKQIAEFLEVDVKTVRNYEQNVSQISFVDVIKLSLYCRYDIGKIISNFIPGTTVIKESKEKSCESEQYSSIK